MKITAKFLKEKRACIDGTEWVKENKLIGLDSVLFLKNLIKNRKYDWANWLIVRVMSHRQLIMYAVFAAEQVIDISEKERPNDKKPRKALEIAKKCIDNPNTENGRSNLDTYTAPTSACAAVIDAFRVASNTSCAHVYASAAVDAAYTAIYLDTNRKVYAKKMKIKMLNYGISLLEEQK